MLVGVGAWGTVWPPHVNMSGCLAACDPTPPAPSAPTFMVSAEAKEAPHVLSLH